MDNHIGEIRLFAGSYAPPGWAPCSGQQLRIAHEADLFSVIGATFGGDGHSTFALPDLRGRVPVHLGAQYALGQRGGAESVALTVDNLPPHTHAVAASAQSAAQADPAGVAWAASAELLPYASAPAAAMAAGAIGSAGGGAAFGNMQPWRALNFCIALDGAKPGEALAAQLLGEVRLFAFGQTPARWLRCDGQVLPIASVAGLFPLIGTLYGGDGRQTLALPDLRGRAAMHPDAAHPLAWRGGEAAHTLTQAEMPMHTHKPLCSTGGAQVAQPAGNTWAKGGKNAYAKAQPGAAMHADALMQIGSGQPYDAMQPWLGLNHCIAIDGENSHSVEPWLGEIRLFAGQKAPDGWMPCDGQTLRTAAHGALFSVIGATYGGDGKTTFALPDLRGRVPIHQGQGAGLSPRALGEGGGAAVNTLTEENLPPHTHAARCGSKPENASPAGRVWSATAVTDGLKGEPLYAKAENLTSMAAGLIGSAGGGQPVSNLQPSLALQFIIAVEGLWPNPPAQVQP